MIIYINGQMTDSKEAMVSVYDHGFLYGLGLFETFRTYNKICFLLEEHMERLLRACDSLGIQLSLSVKQVQHIVDQLLVENDLEEAYVRLTISAGVGELGLPTDDYTSPTVVVMVKSLTSPPYEQWVKGKALQQLTTVRNSPEGKVRYKSLHYMNNIIAKRELLALGDRSIPGAEGLMLTESGYVAEGIVSNLFFVRNGIIYTPHIDTGILPGVTRAHVITVARSKGYVVQEGYYSFAEMADASEIWMTSSIQELIPITLLLTSDGTRKQISNGEAGEVCKTLAQYYRADTSGLD